MASGANPGLREPLLKAGEDGAPGGADGQEQPAAAAAAGSEAAALPAGAVQVDPEAPLGQRVLEEKHAHRREIYGLMLNALSTVFGTGMSLFAKISGSQGIGVFEIVLTRSLILVLFTGPDLIYYRVNPFQDKRRRWLLVLRGVLGFCSVSSLYLAVALLPLADASVLSFLSPIFVAALSPIVLKERSPWGTLLGIPVAMVGVVLVAKPSFLFGGGGNISGLGVMVGIAQAFFNAMARMCVRALSLGSSERMSSIIFGQGAISCVGAAILCAATRKFRIPTEAPVWGALLAGGLLGYFYQLALTAGLQRARAAPAVAMSYLSVIWGILADVFVFHDLPPPLSLVGAAIICCSSFLVAFSQKRRSAHTAADTRWKQSTVRLQQEQQQRLLGGEGGSEGDEDEVEEPTTPVSPTSEVGEMGVYDGLPPAVKTQVLAAKAAAAEVSQPGTPEAPLLEAPAPQQHGSAESLPPLAGAQPESNGAADSSTAGSAAP